MTAVYSELYHRIYAAPLTDIRMFMLLSVSGWALIAVLCGLGRKSARAWIGVNRVLAVCAMLGVLFVTCFARSAGATGISLRLFQIPEEEWRADEYRRMLLMNVLLYLPLGLSLSFSWPALWSLGRKASYTLAGGVALSLACEIFQLCTGRGTAEVDDLVTNAAGALLGAAAVLLARGVLKMIELRKNKPQKENNE